MTINNENRYFDFNNTEHKYFFAGLLNTAKNNFDLTLTELGRRIKSKNINKGLINEAFNDTITDADWNSRIGYLSESLVFVKYFKYEERASFRNTLYALYETIDSLRNYYTHYIHDEIEIKSSVFEVLDRLMLISAKTVKKNRAKSEEYKVHLSEKYSEEFSSIIEKSNTRIDEYNLSLAKGERKREYIKPKDEVNHVLNFVFRSFIFNDKKKGEERLSINASSKVNIENKFSTYGFVQLLAMFLNKKQTESLLSYTKYLKGNQTLAHVVNRWTLTFLCYKDIRKFFKSDYSNDSLLLQMVSELTKCPNELYKHLSPEKKQEFIEDLNVYFKDNEEFENTNDQTLVQHEVIRKRYKDSFPYFAIRFLDEIADFPNLRFHINLGKFNHHTMPKSEGTVFETERSILEKITVFEKLSKATKYKKEYFLKPENKDLINDWIEFPSPGYQFNHNNIGVWLNVDDSLGKSDAVTNRENNKLSKFKIAKKLNLEEAVKKPVAFLSFNELPALLYALLIDNKTPKEIENKIRTKIFEQRNLIREFDSKSDISDKRIPVKLKKAIELTSSKIDIKKLKNDIQKEIDKDPLEEIRKNYRQPTRFPNEFSNGERGKIATWLTNDIKRFTRKKTREFFKGHQVSTFQALFAFYDVKKPEVKDFTENELRLDLKLDNPFNGVDFSKQTLVQFYKAYLQNRKKYLSYLLKSLDKERLELEDEIFNAFTKNLYEIKTIEAQKEYFLLNNPVNLPRGIFDDKPTSYDKNKESQVELANWFEQSNDVCKAQEFYNYNKIYDYLIEFSKWNPRKRRKELRKRTKQQIIKINNGLTKQYKDDLPKNTQKEIYKNEKRIRKIMREDFYVLEMAKQILGQKSINDITLKDVYLTKDEKEAIIENSKKQSQRAKGDYSENIINDSHILSKKREISILNGKIKDVVSIKQIGKLENLKKTKELNNLWHIFQKKKFGLLKKL